MNGGKHRTSAGPTGEPAPRDRLEQNRKNCRSGLYKVVHALLAGPLRLIGHIHVIGRENEPRRGDGAYLVICNHMTWKDPVYLCASLTQQQPHFMGKKELFRIPLLGPLLRALGAYPVDRGGADVGAIRRTIHMLENGVSVGMFPQGHRNNGIDPRDTFDQVKQGAAMIALRANVPVLPVYIRVKDNRVRAFHKKEIIIGKPVTPEEMHYDPERPGEYKRIMTLLFERVCQLAEIKTDTEQDN